MFREDDDDALDTELKIRGLATGSVWRPLDSTVGDLRLAVEHALGGRSVERDRLIKIGTFLIDGAVETILDDNEKTLRDYGLTGTGLVPTVRVVKPRGPPPVIFAPAEAGQPQKVWVRVRKKKPVVVEEEPVESKESPAPGANDLDNLSDTDATPPASSSSSSDGSDSSETRYRKKEARREERERKRLARGEARIRRRFANATKPEPPEAPAVLGGERDWRRSLSSCCSTPSARTLALKAFFCMPCAYGLAMQQERLRFSVLVNVLCCCVVSPWNRTLLRDKRRLKGSAWSDYCLHCCPVTCCCAKCQEIWETQAPPMFLVDPDATAIRVQEDDTDKPQSAPLTMTMDDTSGSRRPSGSAHAKVLPDPSNGGTPRKKVTFKSLSDEGGSS